MDPRVRPRIGLLPVGHSYYWDQFPELKEMGLRMGGKLRRMLSRFGEIVGPDLVDTEEASRRAGKLFGVPGHSERVDRPS